MSGSFPGEVPLTRAFPLPHLGESLGDPADGKAIVASIERNEAPSSVRQLQDAGKVVVGAAGTAAVDRVRAEVVARSSRAAVELKALANAIRASATSLRDQGHGTEAGLAEDAAGKADRLAAHLANASSDELLEDARRLSREAAAYARREPVLVVAGAFTIGLLIPKVLDALGTRRSSERSQPMATTQSATSSAARPPALETDDRVGTPEIEEDL